MSEEIAELRARLGESTALWAGSGVTMHTDGWTAFSGARSVDYNVALCHGDGDSLDACVETVLARRVPTVVMVTGPALAEVQRLVARSWVCVGATPVMVRPLAGDPDSGDPPAGPAPGAITRCLDDDAGLAAGRALAAAVFEIEPQLAAVALPPAGAGHGLWGAFDDRGRLCSCLALSRVQETVAVWSMATAADARGLGYGRAALQAALRSAADDGARRALLYASPAGEPFYRRVGFTEVERWQMWSRPRWVLGRA